MSFSFIAVLTYCLQIALVVRTAELKRNNVIAHACIGAMQINKGINPKPQTHLALHTVAIKNVFSQSPPWPATAP